MDTKGEIREFLTSRRAKLTPQQAGLPVFGGSRRVPGLRREEAAMLAGVSVDYYTRLEQGRPITPSDSVLDAIAAALRLDTTERTYLHTIARPKPGARRRTTRTGQTMRPGQCGMGMP